MITSFQRQQLQQYSVYTQPAGPVLFHAGAVKEHLAVIQEIIQAPHKTAAASYFTRRLGMFVSMQLWNLTLYDEVWQGSLSDIQLFGIREYNLPAVSLVVDEEAFVDVEDRKAAVKAIWAFTEKAIQNLSSSPAIQKIHWENVFGYLIWHYHVFLQQGDTREKALNDWLLLHDDEVWSDTNHIESFTHKRLPAELLYAVVRKTCCLAKDIPGQLTCGSCPLPSREKEN